MSDLKVKTLEETIVKQQTQIQLLQTRLEDAIRQIQDITVNAIERASRTRALNHIHQMVMEQIKNHASSI